jgi:hypothetical protein
MNDLTMFAIAAQNWYRLPVVEGGAGNALSLNSDEGGDAYTIAKFIDESSAGGIIETKNGFYQFSLSEFTLTIRGQSHARPHIISTGVVQLNDESIISIRAEKK